MGTNFLLDEAGIQLTRYAGPAWELDDAGQRVRFQITTASAHVQGITVEQLRDLAEAITIALAQEAKP